MRATVGLHDVSLVFLGVAVGMLLFVFLWGAPLLSSVPGARDVPDAEMEVACYKWVENGTAHVQCPDLVYSPDAVVNITVKPCTEYEYKIDEQRPCGP